MSIPRGEHPRPQFMREHRLILNGVWQFEFDDGESGEQRGLHMSSELSAEITVPFCPESALSGVRRVDFFPRAWYKRHVTLPEEFAGKRIILHIDACDYKTTVWVNGEYVGVHIGGYVSFSFDITPYVSDGDNVITVLAEDRLRSHNQPSGKQSDKYESYGCFYTRTTGIWQTVWLEAVEKSYIVSAKYITGTDGTVEICARVKDGHAMTLAAEASFGGKSVAKAAQTVSGDTARLTLRIPDPQLWAPGAPHLYDLQLSLGDDTVYSYFGIREISYSDHRMYLNGKSIFGRFILDQGFYPDGIYTAPDDDALKRDILLAQECGFNGARLHQKIFEPRFLYYCDVLGYMVWGEHASWGLDIHRPDAFRGFIGEWVEAVNRDFNHPAVIGWCPFNETQPDQDVELIKTVYNITKSIDPTRPVIDCSGWMHVEGCCDMYDAHDYEQDPDAFAAKYAPLSQGARIPSVFAPQGLLSPDLCFLSEFGGTQWTDGADSGWGYGSAPGDKDEFIRRYKGRVDALLQNDKICAFCYTQLTDVEQELNGLYTYDRRAKFDTAVLHAITSAKAAAED